MQTFFFFKYWEPWGWLENSRSKVRSLLFLTWQAKCRLYRRYEIMRIWVLLFQVIWVILRWKVTLKINLVTLLLCKFLVRYCTIGEPNLKPVQSLQHCVYWPGFKGLRWQFMPSVVSNLLHTCQHTKHAWLKYFPSECRLQLQTLNWRV